MTTTHHTYEINGLLKHAEEDDYKQGCLSGTLQSFFIDQQFSALTVNQLIEQVCDFLGCGLEAVQVNACDEPGRIDWSMMENTDDEEPSPHQYANWKAGRVKLWYATYTGNVEYVERTTGELIEDEED